MSWQIKTFYLASGSLYRTITDGVDEASSLPVVQEITSCTVEPWGDCKELDFVARNDRLTAVAGMPVQYLEDSNPIFWGVVAIHPSEYSKGAGPADDNADALEKFTILGGKMLLQKSIIGNKIYEEDTTDIATQMYELGNLYGHPRLTFNQANFPATGINTSILAAPQQDLASFYDSVTQQITGGTPVWGVDATSAVFLKVL